jgi:hypothetical protein
MQSLITRGLILLLFAVLVIGCGASNIALKPDFWQSTNQTVGVAIVKPPIPAAHRAGAQGLLDMAITSAMAGSLESHLQKMDLNAFSEIADTFATKLISRGIKAKRIADPIDLLTLPNYAASGSSGKVAEKDFRQLSKQEGIDMLILLSIERCGTLRSYYGFIALGSPKAFCLTKGQMVNLSSNTLEWSDEMEEDKATVEVLDEWDQSPDFPNVTKAFQSALQQGKRSLEAQFFKTVK